MYNVCVDVTLITLTAGDGDGRSLQSVRYSIHTHLIDLIGLEDLYMKPGKALSSTVYNSTAAVPSAIYLWMIV
jgi:hypothetical protein